MFFHVFEEAFVPAKTHDVDLFGCPGVHVQAAHKSKVHTKAPVQPGTLIADEKPQCRGGPLWVGRPTLDAHLVGFALL